MQKKLIATVVAGLVAGTAFAQSNVIIYGVADATFDAVSTTGASYQAPPGSGPIVPVIGNLPSRNRVTFNDSYIGFKGSESLGNGLTAVFQIETSVGEDSAGSFGSVNSSSYGWANRDTMVALAGGFGTIAFGNITGPTRLLGTVMDPNAGATGIGANTALLGKLGGGAGGGYFDQRIANAIAYISPTFGGFYGVIGYLPNENRGYDGDPAASETNTSAWTFGGVYANGPILAGLAYTTVKDANADDHVSSFALPTYLYAGSYAYPGIATPIRRIDNARAAFKYDFGMVAVGIMYDRTKADLGLGNGLTAQQDVWYIPVTVKLGNGKLIGQYGWAGNAKGTLIEYLDTASAPSCVGHSACDFKAKHFMIGYEYNLSKRTLVKALWSQISNGKDAGYDFLYGVSAPNSAAYGPATSAGADPHGLSIGIRHSF
jgi:predicted porin